MGRVVVAPRAVLGHLSAHDEALAAKMSGNARH